jgi:GNAT superfamily N-acetyltransferase
MEAELSLCVERDPDFLALDALLGNPWQVLVAEVEGVVVGCIAWAIRDAFVNGARRPTAYVGDLKVHPAQRRAGLGATLSLAVRERLRSIDPDLPILLTALRGNRPIARLTHGSRHGALAVPCGTIRVDAIPLFARRRLAPVPGYSVRPAAEADIDEMEECWEAIAPARQFALARDAGTLLRTIHAAPGLDLASYLLARAPNGRLAAFTAVWDQTTLKRTRIVSYSRHLRRFRAVVNLCARVLGAARLPRPGGILRGLHAFNLCASSPESLRALLVAAHRMYAPRRYAFLTVGLDLRDPLRAALHGLWAQPTDVDALVALPGSLGGCPDLREGVLHYETALV